MFKLFSKNKKGNLYGCVKGVDTGHLFLFMDENKSEYGFLMMPEMENRWIPKDAFDFALKEGIIEFIERVPKYVKETSTAKYKENKSE